MVEVLRNSTMPRFLKQDKEMRDKIINLAKKRSKRVRQEDRVLAEQRRLKRKRAREVEMEKGKVRQLKRMKKQKEIEETLAPSTSRRYSPRLKQLRKSLPKHQVAQQNSRKSAELPF